MTQIIKDLILRSDLANWDGLTFTRTKKDSTGGTITGLKIGTEVDVLQVYGGGINYTKSTIQRALDAIGSNNVTLLFQPGTWTIDADCTIGSNFTSHVPSGVVFSVSSGKTLTFSGPVIRDNNTWTSGSGTVTENGTKYITGKLDLTGAVIQGATPLVFESTTDDAYETRIVVVDPTADRTLTIPDADIDLSALPNTAGNNSWTGNNIYSGLVSGKLPLVTNARISPSVGSSALTIALKGNDGNDPSVTNPVYVPFRSSTIGTGGLTWLAITAATSLVVSSGSTFGTSSGVAHRLWVVGINDGGTFRLGVLNAKLSGGGIFYLSNDLLVSSTAEGGAGGADLAGVIYTGTAVSSKAIRILGYIESTQATAGTWATTPSKAQEWDNGMSLPGSIVQQQFVSSSAFSSLGTTATPSDNTIPLLTEGNSVAALDLSITPTSAINMLMIESHIHLRTGDPSETTIHLHQDSTSNALAAYAWNGGTNMANVSTKSQVYRMTAGTASSTTFKWRAGSHTGSTIAVNSLTGGVGGAYNGTAYSWAQITELMV